MASVGKDLTFDSLLFFSFCFYTSLYTSLYTVLPPLPFSTPLCSPPSLCIPIQVALVGKGLTFDSGGYNLKVGGGSMIELMKFDMGGCAAVLGCAKAISQLRPKVSEILYVLLCGYVCIREYISTCMNMYILKKNTVHSNNN